MAVYTKIMKQDIEDLFQEYDGIEELNGIAEGVEKVRAGILSWPHIYLLALYWSLIHFNFYTFPLFFN